MSEVSLVRCSDYEPDGVCRSVATALDLLGGISRFVKPGDRVLLKVNLLTGTAPDKAVTTHPAVVRAAIRQVRAAGAFPVVGDCGGSEGPPNENRFRNACKVSGIAEVCEQEDVGLTHLSAESVEVENPDGRAFKHFTLARGVVEADAIINLPKLKTHGLCLFTGGVKINYGCLPGLTKLQMHVRAQGTDVFADMLVDLMLAVKPTVTIMDAVIGMDGDGPRNGEPKQIGAILAAADPVALDAVACRMVGIDPFLVPTTRLAHERGAGMGDTDEISILGEPLDSMTISGFRLPSGAEALFRAGGLWRFLKKRAVAKPEVVTDRCRGCWTCIDHCPGDALSKNGSAPILDYDKCIRCYCCQELCPNNAIRLKQPLLSRLIR